MRVGKQPHQGVQGSECNNTPAKRTLCDMYVYTYTHAQVPYIIIHGDMELLDAVTAGIAPRHNTILGQRYHLRNTPLPVY